MAHSPRIIIVGAGIGGLTTAALLAQAGCRVTLLEEQTYVGGCAGTYYHKGYRFDAGATVVGGFQSNGPHRILGEMLSLNWNVRQHDPAWIVHLPDHQIALTRDNNSVEANFPGSAAFWCEQQRVADICWSLSAQGLPFPPQSTAEFQQLIQVGLQNFPRDLHLIPFAFTSVYDWLRWRGLAKNRAFVRFLDAQLLISAQTTTSHVNAVYGATALDLARQGVYHVAGGIGGLAETLARSVEHYGGEIMLRQHVSRISIENGRANGVCVRKGKRGTQEQFIPADFVIGNLTPWSLDKLLEENSPPALRAEVQHRKAGWGAFALHVGVHADRLPTDLADHHQVIADMDGALGEGKSVFLSISPEWDSTRAPAGHRAVTITTHTQVQPWWQLLNADHHAYQARKDAYTEKMLDTVERAIPGFRSSIALTLAGTPVTYQFYTGRHLGMVGGFPQTSLFAARGPRVGIPNVRLVGDSIFPGQSTAGVTLGAIRVAKDVLQTLQWRSTVQTRQFEMETS